MLETKKYELTEETKVLENGTVLYRIKALKDFDNVKIGDLGGWVERECNLSHYNNCWVYGNAMVCEKARVLRDAQICGDAVISGYAIISNNALIDENARIYENAFVYGYANVYRDVKVYGYARVCENAHVYGNVSIYGNARINGKARIYENVKIYENAKVGGYTNVYGNAVICQSQKLTSGICYSDLSTNLAESIRCQTGLGVFNNKVFAYKQVSKDLTSFNDYFFQYKIGEYAIVEDYEDSNESCARGLHFSNMNYWNDNCNTEESTFLIAEINLDDIITVQEGKIRCKKALILGKYDIVE